MTTTDTHGGRMNEPEEPHGTTVPMPHHHVNYFAIFGTLVALTILTVAVAFIHIENELIKVLVALAIASVKALCVALFFMHLKFEGKLIYTIFIVPLLLCVLLTVALIPDVLLNHPSDHTSSLKTFNDASHLFMSAVGGEDASGEHGVGGH
jgi:cytochrome c oxidase subunit 4